MSGTSIEVALFNVLLLLAVGYSLWKGGAPERLVAVLLTLAAAATAQMATGDHSYRDVEWGGAVIDLVLLLALIGVALFADRYWPIYIAALQLNAVAIHAIRLHNVDLVPTIYARAMGMIAYPIVALLVVGVFRHERRQKRSGPERSWSPASATYS